MIDESNAKEIAGYVVIDDRLSNYYRQCLRTARAANKYEDIVESLFSEEDDYDRRLKRGRFYIKPMDKDFADAITYQKKYYAFCHDIKADVLSINYHAYGLIKGFANEKDLFDYLWKIYLDQRDESLYESLDRLFDAASVNKIIKQYRFDEPTPPDLPHLISGKMIEKKYIKRSICTKERLIHEFESRTLDALVKVRKDKNGWRITF